MALTLTAYHGASAAKINAAWKINPRLLQAKSLRPGHLGLAANGRVKEVHQWIRSSHSRKSIAIAAGFSARRRQPLPLARSA
jgi:hypothetical protein